MTLTLFEFMIVRGVRVGKSYLKYNIYISYKKVCMYNIHTFLVSQNPLKIVCSNTLFTNLFKKLGAKLRWFF